ncbi:MAG: Hsp33 family molecular chaperone HslO, partial [Candidatus Caldatribacterium sp.]|nr:Hsp33 family molecular chaperone HslO [Candidatus Caldatribacterium sp.]
MQGDYVVRVVVEGTQVLGYVASSTHLVERARKLHRTTPVATAALGRALTLVGILGVTLKEEQKVSLQIECRGPLEGILVQGNAKGEVRGYIS